MYCPCRKHGNSHETKWRYAQDIQPGGLLVLSELNKLPGYELYRTAPSYATLYEIGGSHCTVLYLPIAAKNLPYA